MKLRTLTSLALTCALTLAPAAARAQEGAPPAAAPTSAVEAPTSQVESAPGDVAKASAVEEARHRRRIRTAAGVLVGIPVGAVVGATALSLAFLGLSSLTYEGGTEVCEEGYDPDTGEYGEVCEYQEAYPAGIIAIRAGILLGAPTGAVAGGIVGGRFAYRRNTTEALSWQLTPQFALGEGRSSAGVNLGLRF